MHLQKHISDVLEKPGTLSVFGLILFTERHPHVAKVLADNAYWEEFDSLSGESFAIFAAQPAPGRLSWPKMPPGVIAFLTPTWHEPRRNADLLETFHLNSTEHLPKFVVFAQKPDGEICQFSIALSDKSVEDAYLELKRVISAVSAAANKISDENKRQTERIFDAINQSLTGFRFESLVLASVKWLSFIPRVLAFAQKTTAG